MKEREWFKHDFEASSDTKLTTVRMKFGLRGVGAFWVLTEQIYKAGGALDLRSKGDMLAMCGFLGESDISDLLQFFLDIELFYLNESGCYTSKRVIQALEARQDKSIIYRANGSKGGAIAKQKKAIAKQTVATAKQSVAELELELDRDLDKDLEKNLATNAPASAREPVPPDMLQKPKPELIPGCDFARATQDALERFCRDHPDPAMRKHYFDQIDVWLFSQKKSVQSGCCIKRLRNWIARNQREKRDWFATNGPPRGGYSGKLSAEEQRKKNWEILEGKSHDERTGTSIFESDDGSIQILSANRGDGSTVG